MHCDTRAFTPFATLLSRFSTVDLAAGAWSEAFECPEKSSGVYNMQENAWRPGLRPAWTPLGSRSLSPDSLADGEGTGYPCQEPSPALSLLIFRSRAKILATALAGGI